MDFKMDFKRDWKLIAIVATVVIALAVWMPRQAVIPGFEGLDAGVEGVTLRGTFYELGDPLPSGLTYEYEWGDSTPRSTILRARAGIVSDWGGVRVEVGRPQTFSDPYSTGRTVNYWVKEGEAYRHVKGEIMVYTVPVTFSVRREGGAFQYVYTGEKVWFALASVAWNRAVQEQSPYTDTTGYGTAWEAPLAAVIDSYAVQDKGDHYLLDPSEQGRDLVLYDSRSQSGVISDLDWTGSVNTTLAGDVSPDTRLHKTAYFPVTMTEWGLTSGVWWSSAPVADYVLKVYTLRVGKYTYTNPDDTPWGQRTPEETWWERVEAWLSGLVNHPLFWLIALGGVVMVLGFSGVLTQIALLVTVWRNKK